MSVNDPVRESATKFQQTEVVVFDLLGERLETGVATAVAEEIPDQGRLKILGVYPNPVSDRTSVRYSAPEGSTVEITLFDALGRRVGRRYVARTSSDGPQATNLNFADEIGWKLSAGRYFILLSTEEDRASTTFTVVK